MSDPWIVSAQRRRVLVAAIALLGLWGVPQVGATLGELSVAAHAGPAFVETLRTPGAGEEALGPMREAVELLRAHGVGAYRVSAGIAADELAVQRLTEGAWPIRPRRDAAVVVSFLDEAEGCAIVAERELPGFARRGVRLARCP